MIAAVRRQGPQAPWLFAGALEGDLVLAWVKQGLVPVWQRDDGVIRDNLSTHKVAGVPAALAAAGARLESLPPYSPDFNPIENLWSQVKQGLKSRAPRKARQRFKAAGAAFDTVTPEDCHGFFLQAGYAT
jgi:transposase